MITIKTVTNCPTCGAECKVAGEGETHYYIPKNKYTEEDMLFAFIHGGTRALKDNGKISSENFKELIDSLKKK